MSRAEPTQTKDTAAVGVRPARRPRRWRRALVVVGVVLLGGLVLAEGLGRLLLGLGTPPLSVAHPTIEYMSRPNQDVHRFGNRLHFNAYGMRADDFPTSKSSPDELRVLVVGDSVISGGAQIDQAELGTQRLVAMVGDLHDGPVVVANVSAGSWGPANAAAYLEAFGWFDADVLLMVWSSHDAWDLPTFAPLDPANRPTRNPPLALVEAYTRYWPRLRYELTGGSRRAVAAAQATPAPQAPPEASVEAVRGLIDGARERQMPVALLLHRWRADLTDESPPAGERWFVERAEQAGVPTTLLWPRFLASTEAGDRPYRDAIHPTPVGQRLIAEAMLEALMDLGVVGAGVAEAEAAQPVSE